MFHQAPCWGDVFCLIRPLVGEVSCVLSGPLSGRFLLSYQASFVECFHSASGTESPRGGTPVMRALLSQTYSDYPEGSRLA